MNGWALEMGAVPLKETIEGGGYDLRPNATEVSAGKATLPRSDAVWHTVVTTERTDVRVVAYVKSEELALFFAHCLAERRVSQKPKVRLGKAVLVLVAAGLIGNSVLFYHTGKLDGHKEAWDEMRKEQEQRNHGEIREKILQIGEP